MFQRILIAWDGSTVAVRAFDTAIDLTRRYDAELVAASVAYSPAHAQTHADREESTDAACPGVVDDDRGVAGEGGRRGDGLDRGDVEGDGDEARVVGWLRVAGGDVDLRGPAGEQLGREGLAEAALASRDEGGGSGDGGHGSPCSGRFELACDFQSQTLGR